MKSFATDSSRNNVAAYGIFYGTHTGQGGPVPPIGEPALLSIVITLGPSVISALALWLAKQKSKRTKQIKYTKVDPNRGQDSFEVIESSHDEGESLSGAIQTFLERKLGDGRPATS